jgi:hypothetical protein
MYSETHIKFELTASGQGKMLYKLLQDELGHTDIWDPFFKRIWFTTPSNCVYIRKDIEIPQCVTYALLRKNELL